MGVGDPGFSDSEPHPFGSSSAWWRPGSLLMMRVTGDRSPLHRAQVATVQLLSCTVNCPIAVACLFSENFADFGCLQSGSCAIWSTLARHSMLS